MEMDSEPSSRPEPRRRDARTRGSGQRQQAARDGQNGGNQGQPPAWRVTPAPDGRGGKAPASTPPRGPSPRWLVVLLVLGLLALNLWISSQALKPASRVQIPYSPTFLKQVQN